MKAYAIQFKRQVEYLLRTQRFNQLNLIKEAENNNKSDGQTLQHPLVNQEYLGCKIYKGRVKIGKIAQICANSLHKYQAAMVSAMLRTVKLNLQSFLALQR